MQQNEKASTLMENHLKYFAILKNEREKQEELRPPVGNRRDRARLYHLNSMLATRGVTESLLLSKMTKRLLTMRGLCEFLELRLRSTCGLCLQRKVGKSPHRHTLPYHPYPPPHGWRSSVIYLTDSNILQMSELTTGFTPDDVTFLFQFPSVSVLGQFSVSHSQFIGSILKHSTALTFPKESFIFRGKSYMNYSDHYCGFSCSVLQSLFWSQIKGEISVSCFPDVFKSQNKIPP